MMSTALPQISAELNSGSSAPWIITSFLLTSTAVTPLSSRFSDIFGRKVVLLFCLAEFGIFSLGCAVAQTTTQMIVFRAVGLVLRRLAFLAQLWCVARWDGWRVLDCTSDRMLHLLGNLQLTAEPCFDNCEQSLTI